MVTIWYIVLRHLSDNYRCGSAPWILWYLAAQFLFAMFHCSWTGERKSAQCGKGFHAYGCTAWYLRPPLQWRLWCASRCAKLSGYCTTDHPVPPRNIRVYGIQKKPVQTNLATTRIRKLSTSQFTTARSIYYELRKTTCSDASFFSRIPTPGVSCYHFDGFAEWLYCIPVQGSYIALLHCLHGRYVVMQHNVPSDTILKL